MQPAGPGVAPTDLRHALVTLHASLSQRWRPEDLTAALEVALDGRLTAQEQALLPRPRWRSWMPSTFAPVAPVATDAVAAALPDIHAAVLDDLGVAAIDGTDPTQVRALVDAASAAIGRRPGQRSFRHDRLTRRQREQAGIELSGGRYNRAFRTVAELEAKAQRLQANHDKLSSVRFGKSLLAADLSFEDFAADVDTAAFVAYYTARRNLRTTFTNGPQARPMDAWAKLLLDRAAASPTVNWWAIAHVYTVAAVVDHLDDAHRGQLLGRYFERMATFARLLEGAWARNPGRDRTRMVVQRGDDSTTWNLASRAYNAARVGWLNLLAACDRLDVLDAVCPGKSQTLIAGDVAHWHATSDGDVHGDTAVWAALPLPWEVLAGTATCTRANVADACAAAGIDPAATGWTSPRRDGTVEAPAATPELVHGIAVGSPQLAALLRDAGVFSGRTVDLARLARTARSN